MCVKSFVCKTLVLLVMTLLTPLLSNENSILYSSSKKKSADQVKTKAFDSSGVIVVLGSSTAAGIGATPLDSAWVNRFMNFVTKNNTMSRVLNLAVCGYTTYDILPTEYKAPAGRPSPKPKNNITYALSLNPSAIIINLPTNDAAAGYSVKEQLMNYDTILSRVKKEIPAWITTTQARDLSPAKRKVLMSMKDSIIARYKTHAIDFWTDLADTNGTIKLPYKKDGTHLNNAGHRILFERVCKALFGQEPLAMHKNL